tara:strand:+ start:712 stop:2334 length:1623 start_codon:yes stop_codon:yes gene_type:complete
MGTISKIDDVSIVNIHKPTGIAKSTISNVSGQSLPIYVDAYGIQLDGTNDFVDITLSSDPVNKTRGTASIWVDFDVAPSNTNDLFNFNDYANGNSTANYIILQMYEVSTNVFALRFFYRSTVNGTTVSNNCNAKKDSGEHGKPFSRRAIDYGTASADTEYLFTPNFTDGLHHIAITWDTSETFSFGGTDYDGVMKIYLDSVLMQSGQSTAPAHNAIGIPSSMVTITDTFSHIYLGIRAQGTSHSYSSFTDGLINDFALFNTDLDAANIAAIYNSGTESDLTTNIGNYTGQGNLAGYWKFEEGSGTTVNDASINSNTGVLTSGAAYQSLIAYFSQQYNFEGETRQEGGTSEWSPANGWNNGSSAVSGTYWARDSNKAVKGWNLGQDGTPSGSTGPSGGVNVTNGSHYTTTGLDKYMYVETSNSRHTYCHVTRTPSIDSDNMVDSGNNLDLTFWVHGYGSQVGDLYVYISTSATSNHTSATELAAYETWSGFTASSSVWQQKTISLNSYRDGTPVYIYFVSQNATGYKGDFAVDSVQIIESE